MHLYPTIQTQSKLGLRGRLSASSRTLKPFLFAVVAGLSSLVANAGTCNVTIPGAATCVIPAGVTSVNVVATGGGGGGGGATGAVGGAGGIVTQTLSGVGGTTLSLFVGGGGVSNGGGGGGGSSTVNVGTPSKIIAGGGGGGGGVTVSGGGNGGGGGNGIGQVGGAGSTGSTGGPGGAGGVGGINIFFGGLSNGNGHNGNGGGGGIAGNGFGGAGGLGGGQGGVGNVCSGIGIVGFVYGGGGGGGYGGGAGGDVTNGGGCSGGGGGGGGSTGGTVTVASNGGAVGTAGGNGSIVVTWTDPAVTPPPPIPPLTGVPPVPGFGAQPVVLDLSSGQGPALTSCLLATVRGQFGADASYVGQSANGVAKFSQGGRTISFYPLQASTVASLGANIILGASNVLTVGTSCGTFTVAPALSNLIDFGAFLNAMGLQADTNAQGVITLTVGNTVYVFRPDYLATSGGTPGTPSLTLGADGLFRFTDSAGNVQILRPAFVDTDNLGSQVQLALSQSGTIAIQTDGTALFTTIGGQQSVLTPDLTLTKAPAANASMLWWQDAPNHYLVRSSLLTMAQGFTVR